MGSSTLLYHDSAHINLSRTCVLESMISVRVSDRERQYSGYRERESHERESENNHERERENHDQRINMRVIIMSVINMRV